MSDKSIANAFETLEEMDETITLAQMSQDDQASVLKRTLKSLQTSMKALERHVEAALLHAKDMEALDRKLNGAKTRVYKGDSGVLRRAMIAAGIPFPRYDRIYSENRSTGRRIKLWGASTIRDASDEQRAAMLQFLRKEFGSRFIDAQLINVRRRPSQNGPVVSYAVQVKKVK